MCELMVLEDETLATPIPTTHVCVVITSPRRTYDQDQREHRVGLVRRMPSPGQGMANTICNCIVCGNLSVICMAIRDLTIVVIASIKKH